MNAYHLITFVAIGFIIYAIDKRKEYFPVPIILLTLGIALSFIPFYAEAELTKKIIFEWFLPAILFVSAYQFPLKDFKKYFGVFTALATVGMLLTAFLLAGAMAATIGIALSIGFIGTLLIASILTPTDPVSVVNILKKSTDKAQLADIVEGESMFNDGTSVVLFTVVAGIYTNEQNFAILTFFKEFALVAFGGLAIGLVIGYTVSKIIHVTHHEEYQVMVSVVMAYGAFLVAEHFGVSGVLATVAAGLLFSYEIQDLENEEKYRNYLDGFWEVVNPVLLSILFIVMGIEAMDLLKWNHLWAIGVLFLLTLVVRFLVLYGVFQAIPKWRHEFSLKNINLMTWAGIKGTMSIALLLGFKDQYSGEAELIFSLTIGVIILSLVVQSLIIYPLTKWQQHH
ncbi:sodium:proton antiporter [Halalkalibacillus sediminis]|uniref:Sodium:proton antiporter n=1 Tax=Halalkalibacillus sediminis TaxID=2018042 RepID=A0A2I0QS22_9BACI|nr:sodium:proton antiporter [Halalkalibacillus sediminis]PKR77155.1 sodium:proton antiporter [Halalkalibacillus sediminis]